MGFQDVIRNIRIKLALQDEVPESVEWINMAQFRGPFALPCKHCFESPGF